VRTLGGNVTSTTVAGIGPAALTMMRALERAASGASAKIRVAAPGADSAGQQESDKFTSVPSQLLGLGSRKTLVGIIPPKPAASPAASAAAPLAGSRKTESMAIAGAPCKSIDVSSGDGDAELPPSIAALRRPSSPTVPFPRPRAASRAMPWELDPTARDAPGHDTFQQNWRERTGHTLRIVLTDRDHRPHLIAGIVVCAAAALVIFAAGRSPVAGTDVLGQATRSLTAEPASSPGVAIPNSGTADPRLRPAASKDAMPASPQGTAAAALPEQAALPEVPPASPLQGEELAPGLVSPPRAPATGAEVRAHGEPRPSPSPSPPSPALHSAPTPAAPSGAVLGHPATGADLHPPVAPRGTPRKPDTEPGAPARPANGDFDFGI
jgi:hypothetical protein